MVSTNSYRFIWTKTNLRKLFTNDYKIHKRKIHGLLVRIQFPMVKTFAPKLHNISLESQLGFQKKTPLRHAKDPFLKLQNMSNHMWHCTTTITCWATISWTLFHNGVRWMWLRNASNFLFSHHFLIFSSFFLFLSFIQKHSKSESNSTKMRWNLLK